MAAALGVVGKTRIGEPLRRIQHLAEALPQRLAHRLHDQPLAVAAQEEIGRRRAITEVALRHAVGLVDRLLDQHRVAEGQRGGHQRAAHLLPAPGALACHQREQRTERRRDRGAEVDPVHCRASRRIRLAGHVHAARQRLAEAVEAEPVRVRPGRAEGVGRHQDRARLDRRHTRIVQTHGLQRGGRQVGDHDVAARDQLAHDLAALGRVGVEHQRPLAAIHLHVQAALAAGGQRQQVAVFAAADLVDADHVGTVVGQQRTAERAGDEAAEVKHADAGEHTFVHRWVNPCWA